VLVVNWLGVYLVFFGEQPKVTDAATMHWALISAIALGVSVALIAVAAIARVRGLLITHCCS
jgi:6-phosphogluconate dehydrogenase (decarboxylating)